MNMFKNISVVVFFLMAILFVLFLPTNTYYETEEYLSLENITYTNIEYYLEKEYVNETMKCVFGSTYSVSSYMQDIPPYVLPLYAKLAVANNGIYSGNCRVGYNDKKGKIIEGRAYTTFNNIAYVKIEFNPTPSNYDINKISKSGGSHNVGLTSFPADGKRDGPIYYIIPSNVSIEKEVIKKRKVEKNKEIIIIKTRNVTKKKNWIFGFEIS